MKSKPFFSEEQVNTILSVFDSELLLENKKLNFLQRANLKAYIQSRKNDYENTILAGVAEGNYLCSLIGKNVAYKVKPFEDSNDRYAKLITGQNALKLTNAMNMIDPHDVGDIGFDAKDLETIKQTISGA